MGMRLRPTAIPVAASSILRMVHGSKSLLPMEYARVMKQTLWGQPNGVDLAF